MLSSHQDTMIGALKIDLDRANAELRLTGDYSAEGWFKSF